VRIFYLILIEKEKEADEGAWERGDIQKKNLYPY